MNAENSENSASKLPECDILTLDHQELLRHLFLFVLPISSGKNSSSKANSNFTIIDLMNASLFVTMLRHLGEMEAVIKVENDVLAT